jgi:hypothetical protein
MGTCEIGTVGAVAMADAKGQPATSETPAPIAVRRKITLIRRMFMSLSSSLAG